MAKSSKNSSKSDGAVPLYPVRVKAKRTPGTFFICKADAVIAKADSRKDLATVMSAANGGEVLIIQGKQLKVEVSQQIKIVKG